MASCEGSDWAAHPGLTGVGVLGSAWLMELSTANRRAVIRARAAEVPVGNEGVKSEILDAVCKLDSTGATPLGR